MGKVTSIARKVMPAFRKLKYVWWYELRRVILSYNWLVLTIISYILVSMYMQGVMDFANIYDLKVYPAALAFFFEDYTFCNVGMLVLVFAMSTFPVTDKLQEGVLMRCGRLTWAIGQLCAIVSVVLVWLVEMQLMVCITIGEYIDFSSWGQVWGSFSENGIATGMMSGGIMISMKTLLGFEAWQAVLLSFLFVGLTGIIYGLIIFCLDGLTGKNLGELVLSIWSLGWIVVGSFDFLSENRVIRSLSPRNWLNLEQYVGDSGAIVNTVITMLTIIAVLCGVGIVLVKKQRIVPE